MSADFSMRQLLACLNISVFNPVMDPALQKVEQIEEKQEAETKNPFHTGVALAGMISAALLAFFGLRSAAFIAGTVLFSVCSLALRKAKSDGVRFLLMTYHLSGFFLLTEAVFKISPFAMTACLFVFFVRSLFYPVGQWQRIVLSVSFFGAVCFLCRDSVFWALGAFSVLGTALLIFPLKNVYGREAGFVFTVLPLSGMLLSGALTVSGGASPLQEENMLVFPFTVDFLLLLAGLWRDMETNEIFWAVVIMFALLVIGWGVSVGLQGSLVLFVIAFFSNSAVLGKIAAFTVAGFLLIFFLSLPVSLFSAAVAGIVSGLIFDFFRYRLGLFSGKDG